MKIYDFLLIDRCRYIIHRPIVYYCCLDFLKNYMHDRNSYIYQKNVIKEPD